jgi:hypothetical protein
MAAFVLGNGVSRSHIDVDQLLRVGPVYGCNALYRTHTPTVLVSTDRPISAAIQASGYPARNRFYTRRPENGTGAQSVPRKYRGFSSGPIAAGIAAEDGNTIIYLLGFDLGPNSTGNFNNVYAGTEFYKATTALPTYTGNWIRQLITVTTDYPNLKFIRVHGDTTAAIAEFSKINNLSSVTIADFVDRINTPKDL